MNTTNYFNTFIEVADDCPVDRAEVPPNTKSVKTAAYLQYEILKNNPYQYTSDDVLFQVHAFRNGIKSDDFEKERAAFFSKGQPCFRCSPLTKRYGWGVHSDSKGKVALYALESDEYQALSKNQNVKHVKAMRSKRE